MRPPERLVLLGHPVAHSRSPRIHSAALAAAGIAARYELLDVTVDEFAPALRQLVGARAAGNVTIPHKERMCAACGGLTPIARRVGAVNTWWVDDAGVLQGDNTDVGGADWAARKLLGAERAPSGLTVGVLGAGGAAAAVLAMVESWPRAKALVHNRTPSRARSLCERFQPVAQPIDDVARLGSADLVVNATSVGLSGDSVPIDPSILREGCAVLDLVYHPQSTALVRAARARGLAADDGLGMLVEQAALAFERWFGVAPDRSAMWRAARDA